MFANTHFENKLYQSVVSFLFQAFVLEPGVRYDTWLTLHLSKVFAIFSFFLSPIKKNSLSDFYKYDCGLSF